MTNPLPTNHHDLRGEHNPTLLILSDTHGVLDPQILELLDRRMIVLHAGDVMAPAVLEQLRAKSREVIVVKGNNDTESRWPSAHHRELEAIPEVVHVDLPGGRLSMEHGHRIRDYKHYHRRLRERHPKSRAIVYGHTHLEVVDDDCEPWVINPGAAGRTRTQGGPSCLTLEIGGGEWKISRHKFKLLPL